MATWASHHPNIVSMSLRNELRESWNNTNLYYNWQTLVGNMTAGCDAIHEANPDSELYLDKKISFSSKEKDPDGLS